VFPERISRAFAIVLQTIADFEPKRALSDIAQLFAFEKPHSSELSSIIIASLITGVSRVKGTVLLIIAAVFGISPTSSSRRAAGKTE
jgi:hypothetical protein